MFYGETIQETRQIFFTSWDKFKQKKSLLPLEQELVSVILAHPEYHQYLDNPERYHEHSYYPEFGDTNPFLHLGLHIGIREQIATNRPQGIHDIYSKLMLKYADSWEVEHLMMEQLAECLWLAQKNNLPPDEQHYLDRLRVL